MRCLELLVAHSLRASLLCLACFAVPGCSQAQRIDLPRNVERCDTLAIKVHLLAAMYAWQASFYTPLHCIRDLFYVVYHQLIGNPCAHALLTAVDRPDQSAIRRIKLLDS